MRKIAIIVALLAAQISFGQTVNTNPKAKQEVLAHVAKVLEHYAYVPGVDFDNWPKILATAEPRIDAAKTDDSFVAAVDDAFQKFGASHIYLATPRTATMRESGTTVGIGISTQITPQGLLVLRTVQGAPADKAGIVAGDVIIKVDGKPVHGIEGIPGPAGTTVEITLKHADNKVQTYKLIRKPFSILRPETLVKVNDDTAKLSVYTFDLTYREKNVDNLVEEAQKFPNLIIDLRDNGGGAVFNFVRFLGHFIPHDEAIGTFVSRKMVDSYQLALGTKDWKAVDVAKWSQDQPAFAGAQIHPAGPRDEAIYKGHIVVLVNQFTGSASEITAEALKDDVGADVVGTKSAGAVLVSVIVPAADGFTIQYPIMDYVTEDGRRLEGNGVIPDVVAKDGEFRLKGGTDPAVQKALLLLQFEASLKTAKSNQSTPPKH